jgi:glycosyltransferase involved in cell wall biosynthesis
MTRVVLNGRFLAQPHTGVQRYARETILALDALIAQGAGLELVLAVPSNARDLPLRHIEVRKLPWLRGHAWEQVTLPLFARGDLLVNFSYSGPVAKRNQVITVHDATVRAMPQCFSARYRLWHDTLLWLLRNRVASVMTVSEFSADEIRSRYGVANRVVVGREGWSHALARGDATATLARHGLNAGQYLLLVGSLKPNKNIEVVARALSAVPDLPWTVAVAGAADARIFRSAGAADPRMKFLGFVPDEDLGALYANAAWFLFPSLYEGFGLPALEAMANGCPVIAANAAALPEVCGDAALYFDPRDAAALAALLRGPARDARLRETLRRNAVRRLTHYTWTANAQSVLGEIRERAGLSGAMATDPSLRAGDVTP